MTKTLTVKGVPGLPDLVARPGAAIALLGEPGSGKTAGLLRIAGKSAGPGTVQLDDAPVAAADVGLLRQDVALLPELTAAENVLMPLIARRGTRDQRRVETALDAVRLPPASWYNLAEELSGGQQQRVGIARAFVSSPPLICLDEPFTELDGATVELVWAALRTARGAGAVLIVTTTDPAVAARCHRTVHLPWSGLETGSHPIAPRHAAH